MGAILYVVLVICVLVYWDLAMKIRMVFSVRVARKFMDRRSVHISRILLRMARLYAGLRLDLDRSLRGELPAQFILISNHQSLADIPLLIQLFPRHRLRFVAKQILAHHFPTVSSLLRYQRHALISRHGDFPLTYRALRRLAGSTGTGIIPVVFPEGTRSKTGNVGLFHEGAARILLQIRSLPVVTVAIDGAFEFSSLRTVLHRIHGSTYRAKITSMRPAPRGKGEIVSLLTKCRGEIVAQLDVWRKREAKYLPDVESSEQWSNGHL